MEQYVRLVLDHGRVMLSGPNGTGKSTLANRCRVLKVFLMFLLANSSDFGNFCLDCLLKTTSGKVGLWRVNSSNLEKK